MNTRSLDSPLKWVAAPAKSTLRAGLAEKLLVGNCSISEHMQTCNQSCVTAVTYNLQQDCYDSHGSNKPRRYRFCAL